MNDSIKNLQSPVSPRFAQCSTYEREAEKLLSVADQKYQNYFTT